MDEKLKRPLLLIAATVLAGLVFTFDSLTDFDSSVAVLYLAVLVLVSAAGTGKQVTRAAQLCIGLTLLSWIIVHRDDPTPSNAMRCLFACLAIGVTGALLISRKRLEATKAELERSRSEVELFANSVPFVLWRSNPRGEIEYLNASWTAVTGLDRW